MDLGFISKDELDSELGFVFDMKINNFSRIVSSSFGYKILFLEEIIPEKVTILNKQKVL